MNLLRGSAFLTLLFCLGLLLGRPARADTLGLTPVLEQLRADLLTVATDTERPRLRAVQFVLVGPEQAWIGTSPLALVSPAGRLEVRVPELFVMGMHQYLRALQIEARLDRPGLADRWLRAQEESILYVGKPAGALPDDFAGLDAKQRATIDEEAVQLERMWSLALAFVVAHELGHHALGAWPSASADPAAVEATVDAWAARRLTEAGYTALGAVPALAWIWALEGGTGAFLPEHGSHPRALERAAEALRQAEPYLEAGTRHPNGGPLATAGLDAAKLAVEYSRTIRAVERMSARDATERSVEQLRALATQPPRPALAAQAELARRYWMGRGVKADRREALRWYELAAQRGHAPAMTMLAFAHETGSGAAVNPALALFWYRRAATLGYREAIGRAAGLESRLAATVGGAEAKCVADRFGASFWKAQDILAGMKAKRCMESCQRDFGHPEALCRQQLCNADDPAIRAGFLDAGMPLTPLAAHADFVEQARLCGYTP